MKIVKCASLAFVLSVCVRSAAPAQQPQPAGVNPSQSIELTVAVDTKAGQPAIHLGEQDFTVLDNKTPRPIKSFKAMSAADEPVRVILFVDAVNVRYSMVSYVRDGVATYLKANEGKLAHPTAIGVLTDQGAQIDGSFTNNGLALNDGLQHHQIGLREINRSSEWGGYDRMQICLTALRQLLAFSSGFQGRTVILWISPGWPLLSGPGIDLTSKQQRQIFDTIVAFSEQMRQNNITLYNLNPIGVMESVERVDYFESFLKGVAKPNDGQIGNLGLQVFAVHSGGLAIESNSDVTGEIKTCLNDVQSWYKLTIDPLPSDKADEYHHIEVKLNQRDLVARTIDGYYANPRTLETGN